MNVSLIKVRKCLRAFIRVRVRVRACGNDVRGVCELPRVVLHVHSVLWSTQRSERKSRRLYVRISEDEMSW